MFQLPLVLLCALLGYLEDEKGNLRPVRDFSESELIEILKSVVWASDVHLVNSFSELIPLSQLEGFQSLALRYTEHQTEASSPA